MTTSYYTSLNAAIGAVNDGSAASAVEGVQQEGDKVKVYTTDRQETKVVLLDDVSESGKITVIKDIDLVLNNHTLTFTTVGAYLEFAASTNCVIHGGGGTIIKNLETTGTENALLVDTTGNSLRVKGGTYIVDCCTDGVDLAFRASEFCDILEIDNCTIKANNTSMGARCIQTAAKHCFVRNSECEVNAGNTAKCIICKESTKVEKSVMTAYSTNGTATSFHVLAGTASVDESIIHAVADLCSSYSVSVAEGTVTFQNSSIFAKAYTSNAYAGYIADGTVTFNDCNLHADTYCTHARGIELLKGTLNMLDSSITVTGHEGENTNSTGILAYSGTTMNIKDTAILADSTNNCNNSGNNSVGIHNFGTAYLENVTVHGNHSGFSNSAGAKLYISGGTYSGYCHGGIYFAHGVEGEAFVNDALIKGGHYYGVFDYTDVDTKNIKYSAFYIGGGFDENNSNVTAYLDGCTIDASECNTTMVMRGSYNEQNNTLNISNCVFTDPTKWIRIDNATHKLNLGVGINIDDLYFKNGYFDGTSANYVSSGVATATKALYRKLP